VGVGSYPLVYTSGDDPGVPARVAGERCPAHPDVAVAQREKCLVDPLCLGVETFDFEGPAWLSGGFREGSSAPSPKLIS